MHMIRHSLVAIGVLLAPACAPSQPGKSSPSPRVILSPEMGREVHVAALRRARFFLTLPTPFCIVLEGDSSRRDADPELLGALNPEARALPMSRCPHTYGSFVVAVDAAGHPTGPERPSGYIDPYLLEVSRPLSVTPQLVAVRIHSTHGAHFQILYCEAVPERPVYASCGVTMEGDS